MPFSTTPVIAALRGKDGVPHGQFGFGEIPFYEIGVLFAKRCFRQMLGREKKAGKGRHMIYKLVADIAGRTLAIENRKGELVAQMAKTKTALLKTAIYGGGSESTIDIAPGVDCSTILALIFAVGQVGKHYVKDAFNNFVIDPLQDAAVDHAFDSLTGGGGDGGGGEEDDGVP